MPEKKEKIFAEMKKIVPKEPKAKPKVKGKIEQKVKVWFDEKNKALPAKCHLCPSVRVCSGDHFKMMTPGQANELAQDIFKSLEPQTIDGHLASVVTPAGVNYWR